MDGDVACLEPVAELSEQYDCGLVVDEAHATGVYGEQGGGLVAQLELRDRVLVKLGTLSKAIGSIGGFACGSNDVVDYLVNHGRSYIFSTAPPTAVMSATATAIELAVAMDAERRSLRDHARQLRVALREQGWDVPLGTHASDQDDSPIIPVIVGSDQRALDASAVLFERGIYVPAIRPPTVPKEKARLRISLTAAHTDEQLEALLQAMEAGHLASR